MTLLKIIVVLGFVVVIAFLVGLLLFEAPLEYRLECNRLAGVCTFSQRLLIRSKTGQATIGSLRQAQVRMGRVRRGSPRIMIWVTSDGSGPDWYFADYSSQAEAEADTRKINSFLRDPSEGRLLITRSVKGIYWLAWILIPVVAALIVALAALLFRRRGPRSRPEGSPGAENRLAAPKVASRSGGPDDRPRQAWLPPVGHFSSSEERRRSRKSCPTVG